MVNPSISPSGSRRSDQRRALICSCRDTRPLDAGAVRRGCRNTEVSTAHQLCRDELHRFRAAAGEDGTLLVGCTQEAPLFSEIAEHLGSTDIRYLNLRETAGWSTDGTEVGPKMAALVAAASEAAPPPSLVTLTSEGVILIYGRDERAIEAAELLKQQLDVTVLIVPPADIVPPRVDDVPVVKGKIRSVKGHLGAFELTLDEYAQASPSSRRSLAFGAAKDRVVSRCDIVL